MRKKIVIGNWKMNMLTERARGFAKQVAPRLASTAVVCAPFTVLSVLSEAAKGTILKVGAQDMYFQESGAYTGEISAGMLLDVGAGYVIVGHSERRLYFGETDADVRHKVETALKNGLIPIVCCGEPLDTEAPKDFVKAQLIAALEGVSGEQLSNIVVAYEPVWAIGTGKTATPEVAQDMIGSLRFVLKERFGDAAEEVLFLYGGSVNEKNIAEFLVCDDIDGALVGGASLDPDSFVQMVNAAAEVCGQK